MSYSSSSSPEMPAALSADSSRERFSFMYETQDDVIEDLTSRFILNLPDEELASLERICFQVEQAHWFYEDFIREANPKFPSLPLKKFSAMLFNSCPLLHRWTDHEQAFTNFMQYKTRVPVCGAIMLNDTWEKCVLVKGWKSSSGWGFPKGKINEDESQPNCAIREVLEETGYNLAGQMNPDHVIEMSIKEQKIALYIVPGVPEDYPFKTKTRKEISKIEWFKLADLPTWKRNKAAPGKFYLISPFISSLKVFIRDHKPSNIPRKPPRQKRVYNTDSCPPTPPQGSITDSPYASSQEANQESSSQSSSADNGDPHTPSPQYTQSVANHVDPAVDPESLDPHFARLLNSLSISGAAVAQKELAKKSAVASLTVQTEGSREPATPIPAVPSPNASHTSHSTRDSVVEPVKRQSILSSSNSSGSHLNSSGRTSQTSYSSHVPVSALNPRSHAVATASQSPLGTSASVASPAASVKSPRSLTSRRSSSTADISPYLSKATEIPSSAKHLKQLALLESVADESARMTPVLQSRNTTLTTAHPPLVPLSPLAPKDANVIYSSAPNMVPFSPAFPPPASARALEDPFQVRSRTSQALHRPLYPVPNQPGSMSMTQGQLFALMNPPAAPAAHSLPPLGTYRFPPQPMYSPSHSTLSRQVPLPSFAAQQRFAPIVSPGSVPPLPHHLPLSSSTLSPILNLSSQPNGGIAHNPLLSILNGTAKATPNGFGPA